jgi:predicted nucleotidyltransferase
MGPIFAKDLEQIILYKLRTISKEELKAIHDINEGFENRIKKGANIVSNYDELIDYLKTKRYTLTRIQRILIKTLIGITKKDMIMFKERFEPQYIRILGFSKKGTELLNKIKINSKLPIITNLKNYKPQNIYAEKMLYFDIISTNIYSLLFKKASLRKGGYDYTKNPYINIY